MAETQSPFFRRSIEEAARMLDHGIPKHEIITYLFERYDVLVRKGDTSRPALRDVILNYARYQGGE